MKRCILVLGMHRSGTSAMAGVLNILGIDLGDNLLGYDTGNVKGHFEHKEIHQIDEELLNALGSSWKDIKPLPKDWHKDKKVFPYKEKIKEVIKRDFNNADIFGLKDPRISILFPLYSQIFKELNIEPLFIVMERKPQEIAESLYSRDKLPMEESVKLCEKYQTCIERDIMSYDKKLYVRFDDLLKYPEQAVNNIKAKLGIELKEFEPERDKVLNFIDPDMKHFTSGRLTQRVVKNRFNRAVDFVLPIDTKRRRFFKQVFQAMIGEVQR